LLFPAAKISNFGYFLAQNVKVVFLLDIAIIKMLNSKILAVFYCP